MRLRHVIRRAATMLCGALTLGAMPLHIELERSTPAAGDELSEIPATLQLTFSAFIEPGYTSVTVTAPGGQSVATGRPAFIQGSDRSFTVDVPPLSAPGTYTVRWRTAGADGHVLEGTYSFTLIGDEVTADPAIDSTGADAGGDPTAVPAADPEIHDDHAANDAAADEHDHGGTSRSDGPREVSARLLHFAALTLLLGALAFRVLLMPRLRTSAEARLAMQRGAWRVVAFTAVALAVAFVLRLWLQSSALHGAERAWSTPLLSMMLTDTSWGRAWVLQAFLFVVLGAGIAIARPSRDRLALFVAVPAALGLAAMPALSGHAAGASGSALLAVVNDATHVVAVGVWMGTLLLLITVGVPVLMRVRPMPGTRPAQADAPSDDTAAAAAAAAVNAFSPIALGAAAVVVGTGTINGLLHLNAFGELLSTPYGRVLLTKVGFVGLVLLAGLVNWKLVTPKLGTLSGVRRLRQSAAVELSLAALVLAATALLTGMPRP